MYLTRLLFLLGFIQTAFAQELWMYPNQGQWDHRILYNIPLSSGRLYIEEQGLTYFLSNATFHNHETKEAHDHEDGTAYHAIKHQFLHAQHTAFTAQDSSTHYHNYFIGADQSKWKANVHGVRRLTASQFFQGGDLNYLIDKQQFAFHLQLDPQADIHQFDFELIGADSLFIDAAGMLHLTHQFGEIT
jgi:hypothetical protein